MFKYITVIPLSLLLLVIPSIRYEFLFDQTAITFFGAPIPWISNSPALSLSKEIYVMPALINIATFLVVGVFLIRWVSTFSKKIELAIKGIIFFMGSVSLGFLLVIYLTNDCVFKAIPESWPNSLLSLSLSLVS